MAEFQSVAPSYDLASAEDPMEVYQDDRNHPADDDGLDIDLDLTTDSHEDLDDDEMIEDLEADAEDLIPDTELVQDEQMIDDEGEDDGLVHATADDGYAEHYKYLDRVETTKLQDGIDVAVDTEQQMPALAASGLDTASQHASLRHIQHQDHSDDQPSYNERTDADSPSRIVQSNSDQSIDQQPVAQSFPAPTSAEPLYQPATPKDTRDATLNQFVDSTDDAQPSSPELTDESRKPPPTLKQEEPYAGLERLKDFGVVSGPLERKESSIEMTAEASAEYARHNAESPKKNAGLLDSSMKTSHTRGENSSEPNPVNENDTIWHMSTSQTLEEGPDERVTSGTDFLRETQPDLAIPLVHPVTVKCQGREMYLFAPTEEQKDHDHYLLSDAGLAAEGLQSLFEGFRNFLGESVSDAEDLVITFDNLGLRICESNVDAANVTLVQVLDIYCQLHYNESEKPPGPMLMTLSTKIRFVDRLNHLENLVAEGVALSQLAHGNALMENNPLPNSHAPDEVGAPAHPIGIIDSGDATEFTTATDDDQSKQPAQHSLTESPAEESTDTDKASSKGAKPLTTSDPITSEIGDSGRATYLTRKSVDDSAALSTSNPPNIPTQLHVENPTNTLMLQKVEDDGAEDFREEEYEDEEDYEIEEVTLPNEENSAGSSTVQGDDAMLFKDEVDNADRANVLDQPVAAPQFQLDSSGVPEAEDVISYDTDEEDNEDYAEGMENDHHWQPNEGEVNSDSQDAVATPTIPQKTQTTSSHDMIHANRDGFNALDSQDISAQGPKYINSDSDGLDKNRHGQLNGEEVGPTVRQAGGYMISVDNDQDGFLSEDRPERHHLVAEHQEIETYENIHKDDPKMQSSNIDGAGAKPLDTSTQNSAQSAEDDDEITFDDEIDDEAVAEDSAGASTDPGFQQTTRSSPGALKRARGYDETLDLSGAQGKERVSVGFGRLIAG
ncbi:MAG: hypothetical protein Q9186_004772 [Xanthomendoza sp. 1 TL-2023]